jgi:hypothetical protein
MANTRGGWRWRTPEVVGDLVVGDHLWIHQIAEGEHHRNRVPAATLPPLVFAEGDQVVGGRKEAIRW